MATTYTLTWSNLNRITVNNKNVSSPYTLKFGDVISAGKYAIGDDGQGNKRNGVITCNETQYIGITTSFSLKDTNIELKGSSPITTETPLGAYLTITFFIVNGKPVFKYTNGEWEQIEAFQYVNGFWGKMSTALAQLSTPSISLSGDTLTIENVDNATSYDVYVDGVLKTNVPVGGGVAMYSVSVSEFSIGTGGTCWWSTNNGTSWSKIESTGILEQSATQIKFRVIVGSMEVLGGKISSETLGFSIGSQNAGSSELTYESDNFILTQNITDIKCTEYGLEEVGA